MEKALLLASGGIDSPVAGYLMKDKLEIIAIHFDNRPVIDYKPLEKTKRLLKAVFGRFLIFVKYLLSVLFQAS